MEIRYESRHAGQSGAAEAEHGANGEKVELRDKAGEVIGYFVRPDKMQVMEQARELWLAWVEETFPPEIMSGP